MSEAAKPADETERLAALRKAEILDTAPEGAFDDLARLAKIVCHTPIALVTLVDAQRAWFKARIGIQAPEIPREQSFCTHVVAADDLVVVRDTLLDPRFADLPYVRSSPHVRFYAGVPVRTPDHQPIGTLCVLDLVPRELGDEQLTSLRGLAQQVAVQVQFRRWAADIATSVKDAWMARIQLEIERALLRGVLRAATEYSIIGTDPAGTITVFNEGAERMLGYSATEVVGLATPEVIHDRAELARRAAELGMAPGFEVFVVAARRGEAETREWTYVCKDGTRVPVSLTVTAMRDVSGTLTGFIGIARDLTAERQAESERARLRVEQAAREAAERAVDRLSRLHEFASALAASVTPAQVLEVALHHGLTALGARSGVVALLRDDGRTLEPVANAGHPKDEAAAASALLVTTAGPFAEALRSRAPVFLEASAVAPILLDGRPLGCLSLGFAEPRTFGEEDRLFLLALGRQCAQALERARLYEAEARARAEAEAANQAKDEFLSMLSHELRTPLTAVLGWTRILRTRPPSPPHTARGLAIIERNAMAQLRLIEDILDISRIVAGKLVLDRGNVDLAALVRTAIETAKPVADAAGLTVACALDPAVGPVSGDGDRLQQVASNLLSNAIKFTPRGGRIEVRLDRSDGQARIQVVDNGEGIPPEFLPHVFERFRQAEGGRKRPHGGLGLGLSIAQHLVALHGGTIAAQSAGPGHGTTVTVLLPLGAHDDRDEKSHVEEDARLTP